ncbi:hypothetical protein [Roseomonas fluvialis]|uniref:DUF2946 domain-containing protein n=1 Tax=Roseomonas fluvialis TaxID=1750527 RepID=A0ABN6P5A4_9PROT|nr:hypothetical protein [Roseomonas fluvialis]BDG72500.1 hypothetical protein Rmf_24290 [Roseomonas fluvialis]
MRTTRRLVCTAALLMPAAALARPADLPVAPDACEAPALHETLRTDLLRRAGQPPGAGTPPDLAQARCPRCGCDLFGAGSAPRDIPDPRNLF